jgi:hypothetical protein
MNKWLTPSDLYSRWNINQYDLVDIVNEGKLQSSFGDDPTVLYIVDGGSYVEYPDGRTSLLKQKPLTVEEVTKLVFLISDVEKFERENGISLQVLPTDLPQQILTENPLVAHSQDELDEAIKPLPHPPQPIYFFAREGDVWHIGFEGQKARIKHLDGLLYICHLLKKPETSISCRDLYQAVKGETPDKTMSEGAAIDQELNIGWLSTQYVSTAKVRKTFQKEYQELQDMLSEVVTMEEREEIKEKMKKLSPYLKKRNFADPNDKKAQINIKRRLDTAYAAINKAGMKKMAKHLQTNIKPDDAYGRMYTASLTWEITI